MRCAEVKREKTTSSCLKNYMKIIERFWVFSLLIIPRTKGFTVRLTTELFAHT